MIMLTENLLAEIASAIVKKVAPEKIILFGSQARGKTHDASDLDLLIIEKEPFGAGRSRRKEISIIRKAVSAFRMLKDILVYSAGEVEKWRNSSNHIIVRALKEGKVLYERS